MMIDKNLPLIDLHRHLEGSVRIETVIELGRKHNIPLPAFDAEGLSPHITITEPQPGVMAFISKFHWINQVLVDIDACYRISYENVLIARDEGLDYLELRFSPWFMASAYGLDPSVVTEAVVAGVREGEHDFGVKTNLIGIISRTYGPEAGMKELDALLSQRDELAALDLAGDEANFPGEMFVEHFRKGREAGWQITVHAGEAAGADSVWQAIKGLGASRIGHAVRIEEDPQLVDYILEHHIGIEANLTSNVQTSTVADFQSHPLKKWLGQGLLATINSDDPSISGITLPHEFETAAPQAGITPEMASTAQQNALAIAFLGDGEKAALTEGKR